MPFSKPGGQEGIDLPEGRLTCLDMLCGWKLYPVLRIRILLWEPVATRASCCLQGPKELEYKPASVGASSLGQS